MLNIDEQIEEQPLHFELTDIILKCAFEAINVLGCGFLESVYKNALIVSLLEHGLSLITDKKFEVLFKQQVVGNFIPDLLVENKVIIELKSVEYLIPGHQAQLINYLKVTNIPIGLLINFGNKTLEYKRAYHPDLYNKNPYNFLSNNELPG